MRKIATLFFLLCVSLVAEDCFKMSGQVFCDNDVIKITKTGQSMLVKVNNIGGGRVVGTCIYFSLILLQKKV